MTIHEVIHQFHKAQKLEQQFAEVPNSKYDKAAHHAAVDHCSKWVIAMINHPDWTSELADLHYLY